MAVIPMPDSRNRPTVDQGLEPAGPAAPDNRSAAIKEKKKKDKVRSAWISFVGRIVAQVVGAIVTVALTLFVVQRAQQRTAGDRPVSPAETPPTAGAGRTAGNTGALPVAAIDAARSELALAVLPLDNFSGDPGQDYFADGMTEALIAELAQLKGVRVISRTSSMRYRGSRQALPEIARELGVTHIIEGSVARDKARVRVTAQLIEATSDRHIWAESYDRQDRDVLGIQAEVATAIAREVGGTVVAVEQARLDRRQAVDPAVYDLYLKGRYEQARRSPEGFTNAIARFEDATAKDPSFAPAFAGLADTYTLMSRSVFGGLPASQAMDRARTAAERAIALDPLSVEAHLAMASVSHRFDWDWDAAERHYNRARDLGPASAPAHQWIAVFLAEQGRPEPARIEAERAISLDPLSPTVLRTAGLVAYFNRDFERSLALHRRAVSLEPGSPVSTMMLAWSLVEAGRASEAATELRALPKETPVSGEVQATLGYALARQGDAAGARQIRQTLERERYSPTLALARLYSALGDDDALVQLAERAVATRLDLVTGLKADIVFDRIRTHPRFKALTARLRL